MRRATWASAPLCRDAAPTCRRCPHSSLCRSCRSFFRPFWIFGCGAAPQRRVAALALDLLLTRGVVRRGELCFLLGGLEFGAQRRNLRLECCAAMRQLALLALGLLMPLKRG